MPFVVKVLNKTAEVMLMGRAAELPLSYADGMIGCMPVFETKEQAESFADGAYEISEIVTMPPNATGERPETRSEDERYGTASPETNLRLKQKALSA